MRAQLLLLSSVLILLVSACGEFSKAMKSPDKLYKLEMAEKYLAKGDHDRAMPLLEELRQVTRGDTLYERVSYNYAKGFYGMKDYIQAGYMLDNFAKTFRNSAHAEECAFLAAICHYNESPGYELDQTDTRTAINQLETFMMRYPQSSLRDSCNNMIDALRAKLETKDYFGAKQYLHTRHYPAAVDAYHNFLRRWPNSRYREDVLLSILKAEHDLAVNSVEERKAERIEAGLRSYGTFVDAFPESTRLKEANSMKATLEAHRQKLERSTINSIP